MFYVCYGSTSGAPDLYCGFPILHHTRDRDPFSARLRVGNLLSYQRCAFPRKPVNWRDKGQYEGTQELGQGKSTSQDIGVRRSPAPARCETWKALCRAIRLALLTSSSQLSGVWDLWCREDNLWSAEWGARYEWEVPSKNEGSTHLVNGGPTESRPCCQASQVLNSIVG